MGAANVDMDTEAGWARFALREPAEIDFAAVAEVMDSASYTLRAIRFEAEGRVVRDSGRPAALVLPGTDQRIELVGQVPAAGAAVVRGLVLGWDTGDTRIEIATAPGRPR